MQAALRTFRWFVVRDAVVVALALGLVAWDASLRAHADPSAFAAGVGVASGVLVALASFVLHEWGHWLGAVGTGGVVHPPRHLASFFLFFFDTGRSTRAQFLAMSYGGYLATLVALAALVWWAPLDAWSGRTALVLAGLGMAVTAAAEIPTTVRVARGEALPEGFVYVGPRGDAH